jgi:hypothetical protein
MGITSKYFVFSSASVFCFSFLSSYAKNNNQKNFRDQPLLSQVKNYYVNPKGNKIVSQNNSEKILYGFIR